MTTPKKPKRVLKEYAYTEKFLPPSPPPAEPPRLVPTIAGIAPDAAATLDEPLEPNAVVPGDLEARVDAALERLSQPIDRGGIQPGGPGTKVTCPKCKHEDVYAGDAHAEVIRCDECDARLAFGALSPVYTHMPHETNPAMVVQVIQTHLPDGQPITIKVPLDRKYGAMIAHDLASVCKP